MLSGSRQTGLSLVELMVGLVVGLIVVAGAGAMYVTTVRGQTYALRAAKLNQDLRATMNVIASDVRRAGYWSGSVVVIPGAPVRYTFPPNPFTGPQTDVAVLEGGTCLMYAYDASGDGAGIDAGEIFGFRFNANARVVQMLDPGNNLTQTSDCTTGTWGAMTSNDTVVIDSLSFSTTNSQCMNATKDLTWKLTAPGSVVSPCAAPAAAVTMNVAGKVHAVPVTGEVLTEVRQLTITLRGRHANDMTMASTVVETVHLPNNRIFTAP